MKSPLTLSFIFLLALNACQQNPSQPTNRPEETKIESPAKQSKYSPEEQKAIKETIIRFLHWYQAHFEKIYAFQEIAGGGDKGPYQIKISEVEAMLREWRECPEVDTRFIERERERYLAYEKEWKTNPPQSLPKILQIDPYLCSNESDVIFSNLEELSVLAAKNTDHADAVANMPHGAKIGFELVDAGGVWKISKVKCE